MFFLCNTLCLTAKFYDQPYLTNSSNIKKLVKQTIVHFNNKCDTSNQDLSLLETLMKLIEVLDENSSTIRKSLIRFRNEMELWRTDENLTTHRKQIIELTIDTINILHYSTFICSNMEKILERYEYFKLNIKDFYKQNLSNINKVDQSYLQYLFKMPKLMLIKRGYLEQLKQIKLNKKISTIDATSPTNDEH